MGTLLKIDNVCLSYGNNLVLKSVCAEIADHGEIVGFIGPSGIGKTSLFRIMSGLENEHTPGKTITGKVMLNGFDRPVHPGEVGVVAQNYPLFEQYTVLHNLMLGAIRKEKDPKVAKEKVIAALNEFDLLKVQNNYPAQLSGGQRQRVSILQQTFCSEHFLLMDEPFSGLDVLAKDKVIKLIRSIAQKDILNNIIIVTHDIRAAAEVADHLWLMGRDHEPDGKIIAGSRIVKVVSLAERGVTAKNTPEFESLVLEIERDFAQL